MENLLESNDYDKFMIFSYLEGRANQSVYISDIQSVFSITYFKGVHTIDELISDFERMDLLDYFCIEKEKKAYVYKKNGLDSINRLLWIYGRGSLRMCFLDYFIKYEDQKIEDFAEDYFISLSKAYRIRTDVCDFLDSYNLNFIQSDSVSEKNLRYFFAEAYFNIFKNYEEPFDADLRRNVEEFIYDLKKKK